jgi:hypothetical protein
MFDPNRYHKKRKKWGKIVQSEKDKLDDMLVYHRESVHEYLLNKRDEYEERQRQTSRANSVQQQHEKGGLRSPPLLVERKDKERAGSVSKPKEGTKLPPLGFFTVGNSPRAGVTSPDPRSPKSPFRGDFRRA